MSEGVDAGEVLAGSVGFLLSKLGMTSAARFAQMLEPLRIDPRHFGILRIVAMTEGQSQQRLAEALHVPPSGMVALIDDVEARGLVERRRNPNDRRAHALHLTTKGRRLYERALEIATAYEQHLCGGLSDRERDHLLALLHKVAAGCGTPAGSHRGMA